MAHRAEKPFHESRGAEQKFPTHWSGGSPNARDAAKGSRKPWALLCPVPRSSSPGPRPALPGPTTYRGGLVKEPCSEPRNAQHCVEKGREAGGATQEELGAFLRCLHLQDSPLPPGKPPLRPSTSLPASTAGGDAVISVAFLHSAAAGSCLPTLVRSQCQLSSHSPLTFHLGSPPLIFSFGQLFHHLSQIHCMQCLFWAHILCSPRYFRAHAQVPQSASSAKQCLR